MWTYTNEQLDNGLQLIRVPMSGSGSVTVLVLANTGSRYEDASKQGIAHFFEHMVFKGTQKYPTPQDLAGTVDSIGANFNAFTSKEYTGYYVQAASRHVEIALDVVSDMLLTPQLRQDDIDREKGVIIEEINMYVDTPSAHVANQFDQQLFGETGLGHDIIGTKETVSALTTADFEAFLNSWYGLENLVLVVAGDSSVVKSADLEKMVLSAFNKTTAARHKGKVAVVPYLDSKRFTNERVRLISRETEQLHFILGMPGMSLHDDRRYALALLDGVLGGNMSSRLFSEVREKRGLCYYVHSDSDEYHDTGVFGGAAGVDPKRVDEALKVTIAEFLAVVDGSKPITAEEVKKTKDYVAGKMLLALESSQSVATYFGMKQLLRGKLESPEEVIAKIQAVSVEQVQQLAQELIKPAEIRLALLGTYDNKARFEQLLEEIVGKK